jgi:putative hydrolase of the HAD superfamily
MPQETPITTLFLDIGGVLLTNGWDRHSRRAAVEQFNLDFDEMDERHHLTFDTYEEGKLSLDDYLSRVVFYKERPFPLEDFKRFMFGRSEPLQDMLDFTRKLVKKHKLRAVAVSNEGKELTEYRIRKFDLVSMIEAFISSCYVHIRKPDTDMYRIALNISQARPDEVIYIDDRPMFVEVASGLGINGIFHEGFESTRDKLAEYGLTIK